MIIKVLNAYPHIRSAIIFLRIKPISVTWRATMKLFGQKGRKNHSHIPFEMFIDLAGTAQDSYVTMSIRRKRLVKIVTKVCKAKSATEFWIFLSRTKNRQFCCLAVMGQNVLPDSSNGTTKTKNQLLLRKTFSALISFTQTCAKKKQNLLRMRCNRLDFALVVTANQK